MAEEFESYVTFHITAKDGRDVELAVMDEFDFEGKHYIACAVVENDTINDEGRYIYRAVADGDDFKAQKITNAHDYQKIVQAYMEMED